MYIWKPELGVIGNLMALINDHNSTYCNTENYHATDVVSIESAEQTITDNYLDNVQAQQDITNLMLDVEELKRRNE